MKALARTLLACTVASACSTQVLAHHSAAAFDTTKEITVTGMISEYSFRNPHVYITLQVTHQDGSVTPMEVEAGAGSVLQPLGFTRDAVKVGDEVSIAGNPGKRNPDGLMLGKELYLSDGTYLPLYIGSRSTYQKTTQTTDSIGGTWFSPRTSFFGFLGASRNWKVTDAGKKAMAASRQTATPQKDCIPIGEPALMFYPVATQITIKKDQVDMKIDWLDSERTIWLDGRKHPPADQTFRHGHSVGHWDGKALVVDSTNFDFNPIGFSTSLPSSTQKHLMERFEVGKDGKSLVYSGTMEDPVYLAEPVKWSGTWEYRPGMQASNEKCDLETAHRFLKDEK